LKEGFFMSDLQQLAAGAVEDREPETSQFQFLEVWAEGVAVAEFLNPFLVAWAAEKLSFAKRYSLRWCLQPQLRINKKIFSSYRIFRLDAAAFFFHKYFLKI